MALYSNTLEVIRKYVSGAVGDLIYGTADSGSTSTIVHTMLRKGDDYYNERGYECYIYAGTNIGEVREVDDWTKGDNTLSFIPNFTSAIDNTSKYELHYIFTEKEYRRAINMAIEHLAGKYLVDVKDETVQLTATTDNLSNTVYTWEYTLPTSLLYLTQVIREEALSGVKLTGTISDVFTNGETITGGTSGATGELAYDASTYIRVRKVDGTFITGETATGTSSSETCSAITAVAYETAGGGRFLNSGIVDPRNWSIIRAYPAKLKLDKRYIGVLDEGLLLRLEGQGTQPIVDDDTDVIYLPPDWLVQKAITFLPQNKIEDNQLDSIFRQALILSAREPMAHPHPFSRRIVE